MTPRAGTSAPGELGLKQRILRAKAQLPAPTRQETRRQQAWLFAGGIGVALAIFLLQGGIRLASRPPSLVALTSLGATAMLGAGIWLSFTRGRSVLGRPDALLGAVTAISALSFTAWRYGISAHYGQIQRWADRPGLRCLAMSVATGAPLLLAALLAWRNKRPVAPSATGASFGAGAGLASALLVDLWCPVSYLPHLLLGHLLPIAVLATLGASLGQRLLGFRRTRNFGRLPA